jgi:hypothetical protein
MPAPTLPSGNGPLPEGAILYEQLKQQNHIADMSEDLVAATSALGDSFALDKLLAGAQRGEVTYVKTDTGVKTLLGASAVARLAIVKITITEVFADAGGAQPVVTIGDTGVGTDDAVVAAALLVDAPLGKVFYAAGPILATEDFIVTLTAATGAGTGGVKIEYGLVPASI